MASSSSFGACGAPDPRLQTFGPVETAVAADMPRPSWKVGPSGPRDVEVVEGRWMSLQRDWDWSTYFVEAALAVFKVWDQSCSLMLNARFHELRNVKQDAAKLKNKAMSAGQLAYFNRFHPSGV